MTKSKETFNKKEKEKKRLKKQQDKAAKKTERKSDNNKGKSLEDMMAYVDEHGNLTSTPSDPSVKRVFLQEDIQISVPKDTSLPEGEVEHQGMVTRFNDSKGYGFIRDQYGQDIFFHISNVEGQIINERDKVTFKTEKRDKGLHAIEVKIIK